MAGSSAINPLISKLAPALAAQTPAITIVYQSQGSCTGVNAILAGTKITGTATIWDTAGAAGNCDLSIAGDTVDVGLSDIFPLSCPGVTTVPADVGDFFGPMQVMTFVVPKASSQVSISAEAAYFVFGFGTAGQASPWIDENFLLRRNESSGTQQMIGRSILVPANKWKGKDEGKSGTLLTDVANSTSPEATIGILATDVADANRDKVKILAYQHYQQDCGYWPDSSPTAFDKMNVRDGHYPIWGPLHLISKVDNSKNPVNANAATVIGYFTGKVATPSSVNLIDLEIAAHTVPGCAMSVGRDTEVGPLFSQQPSEPCGCYFDFKATGSTTCKTCTSDTDCASPNPKCRHGYCEAK